MQQLASGSWRWRVSTGVHLVQADGTSKRERLTGVAVSKRAAWQSIDKALAGAPGRTSSRLDPTVAEWVPTWLRQRAERQLTPSTLHGYRELVANWIVPAVGHVRLSALTAKDVERMMAAMRNADGVPLSRSRRNHARNLLSGILRSAGAAGIVDRNVARLVETPVGDRAHKHHTPTPAEVARALVIARESEGPVAEVMVRLAAITGARRGSLAALRWTDLAGDSLFVGRSTTVLPGISVEGPTKTGQTVTVPLDPETVGLLVELHARLLAVDGTPPVWIIADDPGEPWLPRRLSGVWRRIADAAGLPDTRLHDLRHFVATIGVARVSAAVAGTRLTHADKSMTLRVYADDTADGQDELTRILAEEIDGTGR